MTLSRRNFINWIVPSFLLTAASNTKGEENKKFEGAIYKNAENPANKESKHKILPCSPAENTVNTQKSQIEIWQDEGDVRGWGAAGDGVTDDTQAINQASLSVSKNGGGRIFFPNGRYIVTSPVIIYSKNHYIGEDRTSTCIVASKGSNTDVFKTYNFDQLSVSGNLNEAPYGFSVEQMSIDGNYLNISDNVPWDVADHVHNTAGSALKIFGSSFDINIEIYNVAESALHCEGHGDFYKNKEHASSIKITGRISGKEAIIFKGPGDIFFEYIVFGLIGLLPLSDRKKAKTNLSNIYSKLPCHGIVLDNLKPNSGHVEMGFVHIYAVCYGYGFFTLGTNRFNATHVVAENCLGGFYFGDGAHGIISSLESRANGRLPNSYSGKEINVLHDIYINNGKIWQLTGIMRVYRYNPSEPIYGPSVIINGSGNNLTLTYASQLIKEDSPIKAGFLEVHGNNNVITFQALRVNGNGIIITGSGNNLNGSISEIYNGACLKRIGDDAHSNNICATISNIDESCVVFSSTGYPALEKLSIISTGKNKPHLFEGDYEPRKNIHCVWDIIFSTLSNKETFTIKEILKK